MKKHDFGDLAQRYNLVRAQMNLCNNEQAMLIVDGLRRAQWSATKKQGTFRYTSRGRLVVVPHDLGKDCKWIEASKLLECGDYGCAVIGLTTPEEDPVTKNPHALDGRITVDVFIDHVPPLNDENSDSYMESVRERYGCSYRFQEPYFSACVTDYELPLCEDDLEGLIMLIERRLKVLLETQSLKESVNQVERREISNLPRDLSYAKLLYVA